MTNARVLAFCLLAISSGGCRRGLVPPSAARQAPLHISLDHLRHLMVSLTVRGRPVRAVALYAQAPDYTPTGSPSRDGCEGLASVDDAARAGVVFLRAFELNEDRQAREDALRLLSFVAAMEQGDGEWVNFVDRAGKPNDRVASGRKSMSFWGARAVWALSEAARVLGRSTLDSAALRAPLDRGVARLERDGKARPLIRGPTAATAAGPARGPPP